MEKPELLNNPDFLMDLLGAINEVSKEHLNKMDEKIANGTVLVSRKYIGLISVDNDLKCLYFMLEIASKKGRYTFLAYKRFFFNLMKYKYKLYCKKKKLIQKNK